MVFFLPARANRERLKGKIYVFSGMHRDLDVSMLARAPASPAQGLHRRGSRYYFNFPFFLQDVSSGLDKLGL